MSHLAGIHTADLPLCIDLDDTLLRSNLLDEALFAYIRHNVWAVFLLPFWLLRGQAWLWRKVGGVPLDVASLPYRSEVLDMVRDEAKRRPVYLITGAHENLAESIAGHLGCFAGVAGPSARFESLCGLRPTPTEAPSLPSVLMHAIRVPQWVKNLLVFAALLLSHHFTDPHSVMMATLAFAAFCCAASCVYVINDVFDLEADRKHRTKRNRPLARGDISIRQTLLLVVLLLCGALGLASLTNLATTALIAGYICLAVTYSQFLKKIVLVDALLLAMFYIIRIFTGGLAVSVPVSFWTLLFSMFAFLSLAFVKRFAELSNMQSAGQTADIRRGYSTADITQLNLLGTASAVAAVVAMAFYLNSPDVAVLYRRPPLLWALCPLTYYWLSRLWLLAARGQMDEDPIRFASHDRTSLGIAAVAAVIFLLAI